MYKVTSYPFPECQELETFEDVCHYVVVFCVDNYIKIPTSNWLKQKLESGGRFKIYNCNVYLVISDDQFHDIGQKRDIPNKKSKVKRKRRKKS